MTDLFQGETEVTFDDLVGEGKKFKDPDAVAKKVVHADQHIGNLEKELGELREELTKRTAIEDMITQLENRQTPARQELDTTQQEPGKDKADLAAQVQELLKTEKEKDRREANIHRTKEGLRERFGADFNQRLEGIAQELSVSKDFLSQMAAASPDGFLKLVDSVAKPDDNRPTTPPRGSVDPFKISPDNRKNKAYYDKIRKEDPNLYFSRRVQNEMHSQAMSQGASFYQ